ncbi:MAG: glycosyltransferase family 2 protein [Rhizobiaceae bacterium]|nr:glycosyltransferase family 2 protein [Rhizobiaceae bacterium]
MSLVVVIATYNGAPYIEQQILSILGGSLVPDRLIIRDDHSNDATLDIVAQLSKNSEVKFDIKKNPTRLGSTLNFLTMLKQIPRDVNFVALSDQDDIWEPWKLEKSMEKLASTGDSRPALYCSRQQLVNAEGKSIKLSPANIRGPSFANALVENIVSGCTSVINRSTLNLIHDLETPDVFFHDWWLYLIVSGCGGNVFFDSKPGIRYRQHSANIAGSPVNFFQNLKGRFRRQISGQSRELIGRNTAALLKASQILTDENNNLLNKFEQARNANLSQRMAYAYKTPLHRQTTIDSAIMRALLATKRI